MGVMQGLLVWLTVVMAELAVAHTALDSLCAMLLHQSHTTMSTVTATWLCAVHQSSLCEKTLPEYLELHASRTVRLSVHFEAVLLIVGVLPTVHGA